MENDILDKNWRETYKPTTLKVRTKDLVVLERGILIASTLYIVILYLQYGMHTVFYGILIIITPLLYTMLWRKKSTKFDLSTQIEELQSGGTLILALIGIFQSSLLIVMGLGAYSFLGMIVIVYGAACLFYIIKSLLRSYKIEHS